MVRFLVVVHDQADEWILETFDNLAEAFAKYQAADTDEKYLSQVLKETRYASTTAAVG